MTIEEAKENLKYLIGGDCTDTQVDYVDEIQLAIEALDKQIPKKPLDICTPVITWGLCPNCKGELRKLGNEPNKVLENDRYCPDCGQALDWSGEK